MTDTVDTCAQIFRDAKQYHPTPLSEYIYYEKYSRYRYDLERREVWPETVQRAVDFLRELSENRLSEKDYEEIHQAILNMEVLPSMRLMAMAGDAGKRSHITLYNCSYLPVDSLESFVEALILSMSGTGVGYSVESQYTQQLPSVIPQRGIDPTLYVIEDSAEGWANALRTGLHRWFNGFDIVFDYSLLRSAGSVLRTKGGRASGPAPLEALLVFVRDLVLSRQGVQLSTLDCHDIMGHVALGAVSGGMRRSAMIALYDWNDDAMRHCKDGEFWNDYPWRTTANNSAVLTGTDIRDSDLKEHFISMVNGGNGEPGIFSRDAANAMAPSRRARADFGTNPCGEISLRPRQFCNLSEVILRKEDTWESILRKTRLATIIGTIQSMATTFPGLSETWKKNCEEERLLGVGFTGQMDCPTFQDPWIMTYAKNMAVSTNMTYAKVLGINASASVTCVKPSGSTALLTDSSSGVHTRWSDYYIRRFRTLAQGPMAQILARSMAPLVPEIGQDWDNASLYVVSFPVKAPEGTKTNGDRTALEQCEYWKMCKLNLTEHNPSVTITYRPEEVQDVEDWIVANRSILGGMAFLPHFDEDIGLKQMPYEKIGEMEYNALSAEFPEIDYSILAEIEKEDHTTTAQEVACSSGLCEI